jgi:hypothetical protein
MNVFGQLDIWGPQPAVKLTVQEWENLSPEEKEEVVLKNNESLIKWVKKSRKKTFLSKVE